MSNSQYFFHNLEEYGVSSNYFPLNSSNTEELINALLYSEKENNSDDYENSNQLYFHPPYENSAIDLEKNNEEVMNNVNEAELVNKNNLAQEIFFKDNDIGKIKKNESDSSSIQKNEPTEEKSGPTQISKNIEINEDINKNLITESFKEENIIFKSVNDDKGNINIYLIVPQYIFNHYYK
jgi:hypothetical protein